MKQKGLRYWLTALLIFVLTITGSGKIYEFLHLGNVRAAYFQFLLDRPRPLAPREVSIVLVGDDEYWSGELAGRVPIKRRYLAKLVQRLANAGANVIALDFDVRLPNPDSNEVPAEYTAETCELIGAIKQAVAAQKKVVLATPVHYVGHGRYRQESDIYQANGLCQRPHHDVSSDRPCGIAFSAQENTKVGCGYITLPYDLLAVPGQIDMDDGGLLDSFGLAVARAHHPTFVENHLAAEEWHEVRYTNFISEQEFSRAKARFSSRQVLTDDVHFELPAVIVGADWSSFAAGRGRKVDQHRTAIGNISGGLLHANYAEALLDSRALVGAPEWVLHVLEIAVSLFAAVCFALIRGVWPKLGAMAALLVLLFFVQWAVLRQFAVFFDAFFPVLGLGLHSVYERLLGTHEGGHAAEASR